MRAADFLTEFSKVQEAFRWEYLENGAIRGVEASGRSRHAFDPLTAVLSVWSGQDPAGSDRMRAAEVLGLSPVDAEAIRDASDGILWKWVGGDVVLDARADWLREAIVVSAGLELDDIGAVHPLAREVGMSPAGVPLEPEAELQHF
jgi:hypothetical protein